MAAYYNEFDPYAAQWLRNLIAAGHIAPGDVDERSIVDVKPDDLRGYAQCHFFAGIGGWSLALRMAGWDDDRPVWTGSCPCQPFSSAGKKEGHADERHVWPNWFRLIRECRPPEIFGEQVAGAIAFGWWDDVAADLEAENYACAAAVLPACSVGKPHKRDRLWFVANASKQGFSQWRCGEVRESRAEQKSERYGALGDPEHDGRNRRQVAGSNDAPIFDYAQRQNGTGKSSGAGESFDVADTFQPRPQRQPGDDCTAQRRERPIRPASKSDTIWVNCPDGKARPVKSGLRLLANDVPARVGRLRAYGNAIVPQVAAEFIKAAVEAIT